VVVLFQILAAEINFGYKFQTAQCVSFNGADLRNIRQLAELVRPRAVTSPSQEGCRAADDARPPRPC